MNPSLCLDLCLNRLACRVQQTGRMYARTQSATPRGIDGEIVIVEASLYRSLPRVQITGLASEVVRESRDRVCGAITALGFADIPTEKLVVHLSPASIRKEGSHLDLAMAMAILSAEGKLPSPQDIERSAFLGELGLNGEIRGVRGILSLIQPLLQDPRIDQVVVPAANQSQVGLLFHSKIKAATHFREVLRHFCQNEPLPQPCFSKTVPIRTTSTKRFSRVVGQTLGKRSLQIAAAGWHPLLFVGPPGVGKSLLSRCAPDLLPPLTPSERVEVLQAHSLLDARAEVHERPFRSPHHSAPAAAILGGGSQTWSPGEVSLAHRGVLFLDEFPEFRRDVLEGLREPMEDGSIRIRRVHGSLELPARFLLIAAMNPCPCGMSLPNIKHCQCPTPLLRRYRARVSGPLLDRFDMMVVLGFPTAQSQTPPVEKLITQIHVAHKRQHHRFRGQVNLFNGQHNTLEHTDFRISNVNATWLENKIKKAGRSLRTLHKILKVARTIADLADRPYIDRDALTEAWALRSRSL